MKFGISIFTKMSLDEITEWAIKNKITIVYESEYNNDIKAGSVISFVSSHFTTFTLFKFNISFSYFIKLKINLYII